MSKNYQVLAKKIIDIVGVDNVESVTHCQTRLRFVVKDPKQIDKAALEDLDEVKGVFFGSGQYQVIIGTGVVNDVYDAIEKLHLVNAIYSQETTTTPTPDNQKSPLQRFMAMLSGIFIPIIPVIAATGLFLGLQSALTNNQVLQLFGTSSAAIPASLNTVISVLTGTVFSFLPALIVWSTFRYFKGTPIVGIVIGLMLVSPSLPNAYSVAGGTAKAIMLFDKIPVIGSQGSVLTALVAGFLGSKLEHYFHKHVPNVLDQILTPFLTMLVTFGIMILGVGPVVHWIENVMIAIETSLLAATKLNPLITLEAMYGFANLGVALAMILRAKSQKAKANFIGAFSSQLFGVSEPTLFGVLIRYNFKPLVVTVLTSGIGAGVLSVMSVAANSYGLAVVPSYLMYIYNVRDLLIYTVVSLLTVAVAFIATNMFAIPKDILKSDQVQPKIVDDTIFSPVSGKSIALSTVNDPVFASKMMGDGIAIKPREQGPVKVYAPQSGQMSVVADTGHAYGLTTDNGVELLIHIGIDTVSLKGQGFKVIVKPGQTVQKGDLLGEFDATVLKAANLDDTVMVVVTNSKNYQRIESEPNQSIQSGAALLAIQGRPEMTTAIAS
ncbi:PTS beta-glucoside transporter subunit IIBCA [Lactiplantibacillus plantarum]|uniref:PTS beta-glucoside transporter subunit IIBCA n=1 Tax=Lactiplantibacillus plantarum TaxID=1590 RepID=UPI0007B561FD|nr:PTS beta-glucoside transporter subunit IIBCA [Lactiplantibacillus plantarum]KZU41889.1 PTS system sucrose-specific IIB component [Lactiplantibacillus plantarum]KZU46202.1 PTS system sucrose-specific IIB component [Lactiplantibacillus plantarum]QBA79263.1 PTS beta-glucoside transporter subunit IIBCA [Lactiplantibacillus plantarum]